jgi:hypothetical protein
MILPCGYETFRPLASCEIHGPPRPTPEVEPAPPKPERCPKHDMHPLPCSLCNYEEPIPPQPEPQGIAPWPCICDSPLAMGEPCKLHGMMGKPQPEPCGYQHDTWPWETCEKHRKPQPGREGEREGCQTVGQLRAALETWGDSIPLVHALLVDAVFERGSQIEISQARHAQEVEGLRAENERLQNKLNLDSQEWQILCGEETEKFLRKENAALRSKAEELERELTGVRADALGQLKAAQTIIDGLAEDRKVAEARASDLAKELNEANETIAAQDRAAKEWSAKVSDLARKLEEARGMSLILDALEQHQLTIERCGYIEEEMGGM